MYKRFKYWLSWICMFPIALFMGFLVDFPLHWVLYSTLSGGDSPFITPYPELPERILAPFFRAFVIVWVSGLIAPEKKFLTAIILTTLWILGAVAFFILAYLGYQTNNIKLNLTAYGLPVIMGIIGSILGLYKVKLDNQEHLIKSN
jgi:hypothetical protein